MMTITEINQIKTVSGGEFGKLIAGLEKIGITRFITCASTAKTMYFNQENQSVHDVEDYFNWPVGKLNRDQFIKDLKDHQVGKTDFPTWIELTAASGIASWEVNLLEGTCVYRDAANNDVYTEEFPS